MAKEEEKKDEKKDDEVEEEEENDEEESSDLIEQANDAAERIENADKALNKTLDRQERMSVEKSLGGQAEAGKPTDKKEETDKDYANRMLTENDATEN